MTHRAFSFSGNSIPLHLTAPIAHKVAGFTLAELLIALVILGTIATFTIPKVLQSQQDGKYKAIGKETASLLSQAYETYKYENTVDATTGNTDLTPYINYVRLETNGSTSVDDIPGGSGTVTCGAISPCIVLHNGGKIRYTSTNTFGNTNTTNALHFLLDPDGTGDGNIEGVRFYIYINGKIRTKGSVDPGTCSNAACTGPNASQDPSWFSWN